MVEVPARLVRVDSSGGIIDEAGPSQSQLIQAVHGGPGPRVLSDLGSGFVEFLRSRREEDRSSVNTIRVNEPGRQSSVVSSISNLPRRFENLRQGSSNWQIFSDARFEKPSDCLNSSTRRNVSLSGDSRRNEGNHSNLQTPISFLSTPPLLAGTPIR